MSLLFAALLVPAGFGAWRAGRPAPLDASSVRPGPVAVAPLDIDVGLIAGRHLFGAPATAASEQAPQSRANLVLGGIWHVADGKGGYALIAETGARQRPYRPGDRLPGGAQLVEIHADRVLIRRDGRRESLLLPRDLPRAKTPPVHSLQRSSQ
ncbi:MAG: type II secretion system protein N [Immundisolibacter sp.]|uniref:type II secretion system protein N n=1 Tax=Immundisolibacter sp. TaxID=1934948 RepID=UPI003EE05A2F